MEIFRWDTFLLAWVSWMPAGFVSTLRYLGLQICAFQGEEMRIKKSLWEVFLGGPKTGSKLEPQHVGQGYWMGRMFAYLDWEQVSRPTHCQELCAWLTSRGNQGCLWDLVGLGYFSQLKMFLYGYPQYSFLFEDIFIFFIEKKKETPECLDFEKAHWAK